MRTGVRSVPSGSLWSKTGRSCNECHGSSARRLLMITSTVSTSSCMASRRTWWPTRPLSTRFCPCSWAISTVASWWPTAPRSTLAPSREACVANELEWPTLTYACSMVLSRRSLDLISYRLPLVCDHLGIALYAHHDAGSDAEAAARVVMALAQRAQVDSLVDLADDVHVRLGQLRPLDWSGCIARHAERSAHPIPPQANPDADPDHPLYHAEIVFTGGLSIRVIEVDRG